MTNNTINLSRELVGMTIDLLQDLRRGSAVERRLRAALADQHVVCSKGILCQDSTCQECGGNGAYNPPLAEPVPPAGGEPVYEVQWNSIHGPEGWKAVDAEEYARCDGPLWDRRITHKTEVTSLNVCVSCSGRFGELKTCSNAMMGHGYYVECASCGAKTTGYDKAASAVEYWNSRSKCEHEKVDAPTVRIFSGPDTHFCWTPDNTPKDQREILVLVEHKELWGLEAHVTRLQAEVERLKQVAIDRKNEQTKLCTERNDLQAEVERLKSMSTDPFDRMRDLQSELTKLGDDYCKRVDELTKARELLQRWVIQNPAGCAGELVSETKSLLLMAAPTENKCGRCGADTACGKMLCEDCCYEPVAHQSAPDAKPAPVSVALPYRKSEHFSEEDDDEEYPEYARGWNACIDEFKRLNNN